MLETSVEYILVPVAGPYDDLTVYDAWMAIVAEGAAEPEDVAYTAAEWLDGEVAYKPGAGTLAAGMYDVYVRVLAGAEDVRMGPGRLRVGDPRT